MESFTYNKIAGAILGTCLVGMGLGILSEGIYEPGPPSKPGYALPELKAETAEATPKAPDVPLPVLLAKGDAKKGENDAKVCGACHNFAEGAGAKVGPDLYGVVGRPKGSAPGFDYSAGMKAKGGDWTFADINQFITKPSAYVSGTKMGYPGEDNPEKRADIIDYLRSLSSSPVPLPAVAEAAPAPAPKAEPAAMKTTPAPAPAPEAAPPPPAPAAAPPPPAPPAVAPAPPAPPPAAADDDKGPQPYEAPNPDEMPAPPAAVAPAPPASPPAAADDDKGPQPYKAPNPDEAK